MTTNTKVHDALEGVLLNESKYKRTGITAGQGASGLVEIYKLEHSSTRVCVKTVNMLKSDLRELHILKYVLCTQANALLTKLLLFLIFVSSKDNWSTPILFNF